MMTLLATMVGFFSSVVPELLRLWQDYKDKRHYLDILNKNLDPNHLDKYEKILFPNRGVTTSSNDSFKYKTTGIKIIDGFNASVRPVLAYSFFIMYTVMKFIQYSALSKAEPFVQYVDILWSADDQAAFAGIISFYFGQRTFAKLWKYK